MDIFNMQIVPCLIVVSFIRIDESMERTGVYVFGYEQDVYHPSRSENRKYFLFTKTLACSSLRW